MNSLARQSQKPDRPRNGQSLAYWSPARPLLGVVKVTPGDRLDQIEYLYLLGERLEELLSREENREQALADAKESLQAAFGSLTFLDSPKEWLENPQIGERLLSLGLRAPRHPVRAYQNQEYLGDLYSQTSIHQWVNELTGDLDEHLT